MKPLLIKLYRYRNFLILLLIVGIFGYTARQISFVINPTPDADYVAQLKQAAAGGTVKIDTKTIDAVNSLATGSSSTAVSAVNKTDPFTQ